MLITLLAIALPLSVLAALSVPAFVTLHEMFFPTPDDAAGEESAAPPDAAETTRATVESEPLTQDSGFEPPRTAA